MRTDRGRVAILFNRIGPYHRARIHSVSRRFHVTVIEMKPEDATYGWHAIDTPELTRISLPPQEGGLARWPPRLARRTREALDRIQPVSVAVNGWSEPCALAALSWCARNGRRAVLMSESQAIDEVRRPWKEALKSRVVSVCAAAVVGGSSHANYLRLLGMEPERIFTGYDVVDNDHFAQGADAARAEMDALRRRFGLPAQFFLASARFIEKKNLFRLIQAFARFRKQIPRTEWKLVLLGDGPLKPGIVAEADKHGVRNDLLLPGFRQYDELPAYYGLASAFIHVSTVEQWGLVVNEAMAAGLPVLVSNRCGCVPDLVQDGVNGFALDPFDTEAIARGLAEIAGPAVDLRAMGAASRRIISDWPATRFGAALLHAMQCPPPRCASKRDRLLLEFMQWRRA